MDNKHNFKKLLCYNIVNNSKCVYKHKCMFAHTLEEQIKEPIRQYINNMLFVWDDLSEINLNEDKSLFEELVILTKECKNCIGKKCPGGYNCKFGVCLRENKICYNDLMYGKCYNMLMEINENNNTLYKCINGIHLSEKKLIPYNQRMLSDLTNIESNFLIKYNVSFNSKNNIISLCLNDNTINIIKDIISNKLNKTEIIDNLKSMNNLFINSTITSENSNDDNIFDDILNEIENENNSNSDSNLNSDSNSDSNDNSNSDSNDNSNSDSNGNSNSDSNDNIFNQIKYIQNKNIVIYDDNDVKLNNYVNNTIFKNELEIEFDELATDDDNI